MLPTPTHRTLVVNKEHQVLCLASGRGNLFIYFLIHCLLFGKVVLKQLWERNKAIEGIRRNIICR